MSVPTQRQSGRVRAPRPRRTAPEVPTGDSEQPHFRLAGARETASAQPPLGQALDGPTDPRWVLAVRTAERIQGNLLSPEQREKLLRLGQTLGLTAFDANLVIAIVQDQARRGVLPGQCPTAGTEQLTMVPRPRRGRGSTWLKRRHARTIGWLMLGLLGLETAAILWLF